MDQLGIIGFSCLTKGEYGVRIIESTQKLHLKTRRCIHIYCRCGRRWMNDGGFMIEQYKRLLKKLDYIGKDLNSELIEKAYRFAMEAHKGQKRNSGAPL